jgi:TolB protein
MRNKFNSGEYLLVNASKSKVFTILMSLFLVQFLISSSIAQTNTIGVFENQADIGKPKKSGSVVYNKPDQSYLITGSGYSIWFERDEFQFVYRKIKGDFVLTANFEFTGKSTTTERKMGWMVRESLDDNASHISAVTQGNGSTALQWRAMKGAFMRRPQDEIIAFKRYYQIIQLERKGKQIIFRAAQVGEPLQIIGTHDMTDMSDEVFAGLFICSNNPDKSESARVWNVRIDRPVADNSISTYSMIPVIRNVAVPVPAIPASAPASPAATPVAAIRVQIAVGSRLEIMNVFDGVRRVIREAPGRFEAPNWMHDGKKLLFNEGGYLYTISIDGGIPEKFNTDFAKNINNDHGIAFDGKKIAISSTLQNANGTGGGSAVYVLPIEGGVPKLITPKTPSYFHGWTADSKEVLYVAQRDTPVYNIYKSPINGGKEVQLTFFKSGHVDGPEASADGKYIYYNGNQSGTMQIWRMKPDGSGQEQLTFDEYNNWFPHISPDGKWIAFISFPPEINPDSHPSYKRVMLRLMPVTGGAPKVIAYMYGGQGSINVTSWSPDSKQIAFVSNSEKSE